MNGMDFFRKNADMDGLCEEYATKWDSCVSKKQMMDLALEAKGIDYVCDSIAKGWGLSPEYISSYFKSYINGAYIFSNGKYTSQMYCGYSGDIECKTTALALINCDVRIHTPKFSMCEIYATGNVKLSISGSGYVVVIAYGDEPNVVVDCSSDVRFKRIQKKEKDKHEG